MEFPGRATERRLRTPVGVLRQQRRTARRVRHRCGTIASGAGCRVRIAHPDCDVKYSQEGDVEPEPSAELLKAIGDYLVLQGLPERMPEVRPRGLKRSLDDPVADGQEMRAFFWRAACERSPRRCPRCRRGDATGHPPASRPLPAARPPNRKGSPRWEPSEATRTAELRRPPANWSVALGGTVTLSNPTATMSSATKTSLVSGRSPPPARNSNRAPVNEPSR